MSSTPQTDPLIGGPASEDEQRAYSAWAERIEAGRYEPAADGEVFEGAAAAENATELLESLIGADALSEADSTSAKAVSSSLARYRVRPYES
ncbi:hypothetical protein [Rathayibacter festucae]|uniref:hypothetical protein n=1 Tax=Rathayibacter festucae TaxID=110937 RepID=UPI002A6A1C0C|nr:hypothetical protein [Rathayibacter festucae]MDY0913658.1 hypothetical protein [Rathayibacter festucae]